MIGTVVGFAFAFVAARGRLPRWLVATIDASVLPAADLAAVHYGDRDDLLVRPARLFTYGVFGVKGFSVYGLWSTLLLRGAHVLPDRLPDASADPRGDRLEHRGHGALARCVAAGACSAR
jgi:hypothetical protein